ncbi:MAG: hypothetical protein IJP89_10575 [Synergistaceae bacterium]|nr:hypothetical protein [Synergistaceae bacterium]
MRNPVLFTEDCEPEKLSSLCHKDTCNAVKILDTVEECTTGEELATRLNALKLFCIFAIDRETSEYARLTTTDCFGVRHYFKAEK